MGSRKFVGLSYPLAFEHVFILDSLDRLPFPAGHFEFVRMHCVGLGVPEDKVDISHETFPFALSEFIFSGRIPFK